MKDEKVIIKSFLDDFYKNIYSFAKFVGLKVSNPIFPYDDKYAILRDYLEEKFKISPDTGQNVIYKGMVIYLISIDTKFSICKTFEKDFQKIQESMYDSLVQVFVSVSIELACSD